MGERRDAYEATGYARRRLTGCGKRGIGLSRAWTPSDLPGTSMTRRPIPEDVADAFGEALVLLVQWKRGAEEPTAVLDGKTIRIGLIFELVRGRHSKTTCPGACWSFCGLTPRGNPSVSTNLLG
jgi:hypothetical protein